MRYLILLTLAAALIMPSAALASTTSAPRNPNGKQWASLFGGKHAKKAKKEHKSKRGKKNSKRQPRAKSSR